MISTETDLIENRVLRPLTVRLPQRVLEALKRQARDEGETEAVVVRRLLRAQLLETR